MTIVINSINKQDLLEEQSYVETFSYSEHGYKLLKRNTCCPLYIIFHSLIQGLIRKLTGNQSLDFVDHS